MLDLISPPSLLASSGSKTEPSIQMDHDQLMAGLANSRDDLFFRRTAQQSLEAGRHEQAMQRLKRAAYYADKPSQAMVAEILWNGSHGQARDRSLAYAWMDLAAERGYNELLLQREAYWQAMTPAEQQQALEKGQAVYARFGDDVARPRLARQLRRQSRKVAGSHTGFAGGVTIHAMVPGAASVTRNAASMETEGDLISPTTAIAGSRFYAPHYWRPELYFEHQDRSWRVGVTEHRLGSTDVGPLTPVR